MIHTPIIPNRQIISILPAMPNLQIMILGNQLYKPVERMAGFLFSEPVDVLHVVADREYGFPACDGVGADHGVCGG